MLRIKIGGGYEIQESKPAGNSTLAMPVVMSMADEMVSATEEPMEEVASAAMSEPMLKAVNHAKLTYSLAYHHELTLKSMLGAEVFGWYSPKEISMTMDPKLGLSLYHQYNFGDWTWRISGGPEKLADDTLRIKFTPAEVGYKDLKLSLSTDFYTPQKGEMYQRHSSSDLFTIGLGLHGNFGYDKNMHKGHR